MRRKKVSYNINLCSLCFLYFVSTTIFPSLFIAVSLSLSTLFLVLVFCVMSLLQQAHVLLSDNSNSSVYLWINVCFIKFWLLLQSRFNNKTADFTRFASTLFCNEKKQRKDKKMFVLLVIWKLWMIVFCLIIMSLWPCQTYYIGYIIRFPSSIIYLFLFSTIDYRERRAFYHYYSITHLLQFAWFNKHLWTEENNKEERNW